MPAELEVRADEETVAADDEFLYHLYKGGELLSAGEVHRAKDELERAFQLEPRNHKGQNLLGLVYFRLGLLDRAADIYGSLVRDNPLDATLRVNLGLVELKAGRIEAAIRNLQAAVDLAPDHRKAQNYLGLALAQAGDHTRAREAFLRAGSDAMARKMERAMAGIEPPPTPGSQLRASASSALPAVAEGGREALEQEQPFRSVEMDGPRGTSEGWIAAAAAEPGSQATLTGAPRPQTLAEFARVVRIEAHRGAPFAVGADGVRVDWSGDIFSRLDGLVAARFSGEARGVRKRFRGRTTEKSFGEGARQMWQLSGGGQLLLAGKPGRVFTALQLVDDSIYLSEEVLLAFEESLLFENGRVPGKAVDLNLVHLRGTGQLLLGTDRPVRSLACAGEPPLRVPATGLVGWAGGLTPRLVSLSDEAAERPIAVVELSGDGDVLLLA